jgi:hypothetical protein
MSRIFAGVIFYGLFAAYCFLMEGAARQHSHVITKADLAAITDHRAHVRAEASRNLAMSRMTDWIPYDVFLGVFSIVGLAVTGTAVVIVAREVWIKAPSVRLVILVNIFVVAFTIVIIGAPWKAAQQYEDAQHTTFARDTLPAAK